MNSLSIKRVWVAAVCLALAGCGPDNSDEVETTTEPAVAAGLAGVLSEATFNSMFPERNRFYSYAGLLAASATYSAFANMGALAVRKREVAAFLANTAHETGDFVFIEEIAKSDLCAPQSGCPCARGKRYFGRGPIQLSWNYNYCAAGTALGLPLQSNPDLVARDAKVSWSTALWFWMTQSGAGARPAHTSIATGGGFGETIRTINGALECNGGNPGQVQSRVTRYQRFARLLGVEPGPRLGC
jgi:chitinase